MKLFLKIFLVLVLPVLALFLRLFPLNQRGIILALVVGVVIAISWIEKIPLKQLGLRLDNIKTSILPYLFFTLIAAIGLFVLANLLGKSPVINWWTYSHLQWAFLPISAMQEFVYRAYAQTKLQKAINPFVAIFITTLLYSGMHILWKDPLVLTITFFGGLAWGYLWYKYPNLYLISTSHAILNFLAIYLNFFSVLS